MRKKTQKYKQKYKQNIKKLIELGIDEYYSEQNETLCGCNCCICNPYYGDFWEYFVMQDDINSKIEDLNILN